MGNISDWAITAGVKGALADAEKDGKIEALAETIDKLVKSFAAADPRGVKRLVVKGVLFPLARILLRDDAPGYDAAKKVL